MSDSKLSIKRFKTNLYICSILKKRRNSRRNFIKRIWFSSGGIYDLITKIDYKVDYDELVYSIVPIIS